MSTTRLTESSVNQAPAPVENLRVCERNEKRSICNAVSYSASLGLTYVLGKIEYIYHTSSQSTPISFRQVVNTALKSGLKGLGLNVINNLAYSFVLLSVKHNIENTLERVNPNSAVNREAAGFVGGAVALISTYPLSVFEAWRYEGATVSNLMLMQPKNMYKGLTAASISDGVFYATYYRFQPFLVNALSKKLNMQSNKVELFSDAVTGVVAGMVCNPFYVISNCQKTSNKTMLAQGRSIFSKGGIRGFYRGYGTMGAINCILFAMMAGSSARMVEQMQEKIASPRM